MNINIDLIINTFKVLLSSLKNLDLLAVALVSSAIVIIGFTVFFNDRKSITNRTFLIFSLMSVGYGLFNYINYRTSSPVLALWFLRFVIFFAVWHAFFIFQLIYVFPKESVKFGSFYKFVLLPVVFITSILNLSPYVFSGLQEFSATGNVSKAALGPLVPVFLIVVMVLILASFFTLIKKFIQAKGIEKSQIAYVLLGVIITFSLLIIFNLILPLLFDNLKLVPFGALFMFPFVIFTYYAISKHKLLNVKVVTTEILTFVLAIITLIEVIVSDDIGLIILRSGVFLLVLSFGILLIQSVIREVKQREKLETLTLELERVNDKLRDMDKLKSEFLSFASHQVKAPINVVKGFATLMYDGTYGPVSDKVKETSKKIIDSADRMILLINNLLDLRKIEEGEMRFKFEKIDIVKLANDLVGEFKQMAEGKHLNITFESVESAIMIDADQQNFRQVIQNIMENSIKYTDQGWVKISVSSDGNRFANITISDSGKGISADLLPHLFEQYRRDKDLMSKIEGTGLGLFIAKKIVEAHHGSISAESEGSGKGSRFFIKLPLVQPVIK